MKQNHGHAYSTRQHLSAVSGVLILTILLLGGCASSLQNNPVDGTTNAIGSSSTDPAETSDLIRRGYAHLASGNSAVAEMLFVRATEQTPASSDAFIGIGDVQYSAGNFAKAYANYEKAATLVPSNHRALLGKARSLRQQNKLNAAVTDINAALAVAPNEIAVLTELAIIYDLMGKESLSAPIYQEILARTPDQAASNNNMGLSLLSEKHYEKAIQAFQRAADLNSNDPRIKNNLATAYALSGNEQMALNLFTETVGEAGAYNNLGYLYMTQGWLDKAERALRMALASNPVHYQKAQDNLDRMRQMRHFRPTDEI